jgi:hypothetical protein
MKFQSVSAEAVTCLLLMVQWASPFVPYGRREILDSRQRTKQQTIQPCQPGFSVSQTLNLFVIQLRPTVIVALPSESQN